LLLFADSFRQMDRKSVPYSCMEQKSVPLSCMEQRSVSLSRSSTTFSAQLTACFCDLVRHFKTNPTEIVRSVLG
jgi:hypothetical protein